MPHSEYGHQRKEHKAGGGAWRWALVATMLLWFLGVCAWNSSRLSAMLGHDAAHVFIASGARGMLSKADAEMSGVVNSATANLALYKDPVVTMNIARCDFKLRDIMNHDAPVNLYLVISPADIDRLRPLMRIVVAQMLGRFTEKMEFEDGASKAAYKHRLLLMLDEFTSLGKLAIIERGIAYMAGYGVKGYFIIQDTTQLREAYGQDNALMANCHVRIAYAPSVPETAEYLSKMAGTTTVVDKKKSVLLLCGYPRFNLTDSQPKGIYTLQPSEAPIRRGDLATFCLESKSPFTAVAKERGYVGGGSCPSGLKPLLKRVAGLPGDEVEIAPDGLILNGDFLHLSFRPEMDSRGREMPPSLLQNGIIPEGRALVLSQEHGNSFDSRHFGFVPLDFLTPVTPVLTFEAEEK